MDNDHQQRMHLVWASVFLTAVALIAAGLVVAFASGAPFEIASGVAFILATVVIIFNTLWLLTSPAFRPQLLRRGRTLLWLSFAFVAVGGALGCVALALS